MSSFDEESANWSYEVDAEAARLLRIGAAVSPFQAKEMAQRRVQERRQSRGATEVQDLVKRFESGGPLLKTALQPVDACGIDDCKIG